MELTDRQWILVVHALLAANVHAEKLIETLDGMSEEQFEARTDLRSNIAARREIVDLIDVLLGRRVAA